MPIEASLNARSPDTARTAASSSVAGASAGRGGSEAPATAVAMMAAVASTAETRCEGFTDDGLRRHAGR
jgi:hypothetical protein